MSALRPALEPIPAAAPARVAAWLAQAPNGPCPVLHAGPEIVWLDVLGRAVGVGARRAPAFPNSLRTQLPGNFRETLSPSDRTPYRESGVLYLGGRALVTSRLVDVRAPRLGPGWIPRTSSAVASGTPRPRGAGLVPVSSDVPIPSRLDAASVGDLIGRGDGLTPYADDVVCGWLGAHRAAEVPTPAVDAAVRAALPRTTTLSATLLECALDGEVADLLADHLRALGTDDEPRTSSALRSLGQSSGHGLLHGVALALAALNEEVAA